MDESAEAYSMGSASRAPDAAGVGLGHALAVALSQMGDGVIVADQQGRINFVNSQAERLTGWPEAEAAGQAVSVVFQIAPRGMTVGVSLDHVLRTRSTVGLPDRAILAARDGRMIAIEGRIAPFQGAVGGSDGFVLVFRDISERQRALDDLARNEAERKERETQLRLQSAALAAAANGVAITDAVGTIIWANQAFAQMTGYSAQEVIGCNPRILKSGKQDDEFYRKMWRTIRQGQVWHGELINRRKDGSHYSEEMTIAPVPDERGRITHFIAIKQDITVRRRAEDAALAARVSAETAKAEAEAANRSKDHFLAVLSHELRTPLTPILASVSMLQADSRELEMSSSLRDNVEMIRRNVELEARLIDDLLDLTRITRGKVELHLGTVDLHRQIAHVLQGCQDEIRAKSLRLETKIESTHYHIQADPARLQQILWNLLRNSIKFTPADGTITLRAYNPPAIPAGDPVALVVEVSDTGIGISPDQLGRIFTPFEQGSRDISRMFGGLGLGLSISKGLTEMHGGLLTAHSEGTNRGATFRLQFPLCAPPAVEGKQPGLAPQAVAAAGGRILLIEDHADTARTLALVLTRFGYEVRVADGVAAGVRAARATQFDLVISDIGLPDGSGLDLIRQVLGMYYVPSIALSGYGQEEDIRRSRDAGFVEHLTKPVDVRKLRETLKRLRAMPVPTTA